SYAHVSLASDSYAFLHSVYPIPTRRSSDLGSDVRRIDIYVMPFSLESSRKYPRLMELQVMEKWDDAKYGAAYKSFYGYTYTDSEDRKSTRLNSSHVKISYAVFCLKKTNRTR